METTAMVSRSKRSRLALLLVAVAAVWMASVEVVSAEYSKSDAVVILTEKNFEKEVLNSPDYWIVEFYAPWCGHCKNLEPEYKAAAKKLKKHARLGAVDATVHQSLAQKYKIQGYPTIKEFGANKKKPRDFQGGRTRKEIVQYVKNSEEAKNLGVSGASVDVLDIKSIHTFLSQDETVPTAIFFGSRRKDRGVSKPPSWVGSLAKHFTKELKKKKKTKAVPTVRFAFVSGNEEKIAKHLHIDGELPALVFIDESNAKFVTSSGSAIAKEGSAKKFITDALSAGPSKREAWSALPLFPTPEVAKKKPRFQLNGLTEKEVTKCLSKKGKMCVLVTKSSSTDASDEAEKFKDLAKRYRRDPFRFLVADANDPVFLKLTVFLEISDVAALVLKPGKTAKFTELTGSADAAALHSFLDRIVDGTTQFRRTKRDLRAFASAEADEATHEEL